MFRHDHLIGQLGDVPLPTAPTWVTERPLGQNRFTWLNTSSGPPTMMASVASTASARAADRASNIGILFCASAATLAGRGGDGTHVHHDRSGLHTSITPPLPNTASFTCGELGTW